MGNLDSDHINNSSSEKKGLSRRDAIKGLATVPVLGAFAYGWYKKNKYDRWLRKATQDEISKNITDPVIGNKISNDKQIRLGIIGTGGRGRALLQATGFIEPETIDNWINKTGKFRPNIPYQEYLEQEDLNVVINGMCDVFDIHADKGMKACANNNREPSGGKMGNQPKRYNTYQELLAAEDIDAVIIATPDHWHATMTIAAAKAGKHVYCEKPMTNTIAETYEVVKAVKENNIVYQLGHQNRQIESFQKARQIVKNGVVGKVNLVEVTTNRNDPNGAWIYPIHKDASRHNIDWEQFLGPAPHHEFSLERFFRWRCWWDYATGLSGDLFTHEYDSMNQILDLGIPKSAVASGGNYFYKDGRTTPDVLQMVFEYPEKELTLMYSASLASNWDRGRLIMGHDGFIEVGSNLQVYADTGSTKYKEKIKNNIIDPSQPIYSFTPGLQQVDAISSATARYFASRGLMYTYKNGKRVNTAHLHIKEWLECIRGGGKTSCNVDLGFEEAITAHMGTLAYRENRKVIWDNESKTVVPGRRSII